MRVTIKTSLVTLIGVFLLVMAGQGWIALSNLGAINRNVERQAKVWLPSVEVINQINTYTTGLRAAQAAHIMSAKQAGMEKAAGSAKAWEKRLEDSRKIYEPLISSNEERIAYKAFLGKFEAYKKLHERLIELSKNGDKEPAGALFRGEMRKVFYDLSQDLGQVSAINSKGAADDYARAQSSYSNARLSTFIAILLGLLLGVGAIVFAVLGISRPITRITSAMHEVSGGNFAADIPYAGNRNEIGEMSAALTIFRDGLAEAEQLRAQQAEKERCSAETRKEEMRRLADNFEATVGGIVGTVSSAALELEEAASTLTQTAEMTQGLSGSAAAASEQTSNNVQSVASATEEMSSSVSEIGRQVQESSEIARGAVSQAEKADAQIAHLSHAASRIGDVVKLITEIAEQTNLLALNATIEAARAGEAGRGFAVVASEVKALAAQTANATDEISTQIAGMQTATGESVMAIKEIGGTITRIAEIANSIASAVEEQGVATQEITRSVNQASQGTQQVAADITEVNRGAGETGSAATQVLSSAQSFSRESDHLKVEVNKFLETVRAA